MSLNIIFVHSYCDTSFCWTFLAKHKFSHAYEGIPTAASHGRWLFPNYTMGYLLLTLTTLVYNYKCSVVFKSDGLEWIQRNFAFYPFAHSFAHALHVVASISWILVVGVHWTLPFAINNRCYSSITIENIFSLMSFFCLQCQNLNLSPAGILYPTISLNELQLLQSIPAAQSMPPGKRCFILRTYVTHCMTQYKLKFGS